MEFRSQPLREISSYRPARLILLGALTLCFLAFILQLFHLTVNKGEEYQEQAQGNLASRKRLAAPRGNIYDRNGEVLATNRRTFALNFAPAALRKSEARATLGKLITTLELQISSEGKEEFLKDRSRWTRHTILRRAPQSRVLPVLERPEDFPGVSVSEDFRREYPHGTSFAHVIGFVGKIQKGETEHFSRPRYLPDDEVGRAGLEGSLENVLAGHPGWELFERDARGRSLAKPWLQKEGRPGHDLHLTLDARLQARAMELLAGQTGSVVVMDVRTGELLVLASRPVFDPASPGVSIVDGEPVGYLNRAVRGLFPPGSTFKIITAAALLESGVSAGERLDCGPAFYVQGWSRGFKENIPGGYGPTNMVESIEWSCNVYYYQQAAHFGFEPIQRMAERFGFGQLTGIDLPGEMAGQISRTDSPPIGETVNLSIGQGSMLVTPLQVARAYAAVANGGRLVRPRVIGKIDPEPPDWQTGFGEEPRARLNPEHRRVLVEGMWRVVNEPRGTAYKAGFPVEWDVAGKTGTAENGKGGVDAWFAGFFPSSAPEYSFVVHLEDAEGHGGDEAAPLAKELIGFMLSDPGEIAAVSGTGTP